MRKFLAVAFLLGFVFIAVAHATDRQTFIIFSGAATDTTGIGMADSSSIFFTRNFQRLYLYLKPSRPCRVAIQVREHGDTLGSSGAVANTDTSKTAVWGWRNFISASTTDSLQFKFPTLPASDAAGSNELIVSFPADGASKWGSSRAVWIPLRGLDGEWYWGENTSIRLRVLGASSGVVTWKAYLKGVGW